MTNTIIEEIATVLAKGFLKSRRKAPLRHAGSEKPPAGLAFPAEPSVHVDGAPAARKGNELGNRRIEGN